MFRLNMYLKTTLLFSFIITLVTGFELRSNCASASINSKFHVSTEYVSEDDPIL